MQFKLSSPIGMGLSMLIASGCVPHTPDYCCIREHHASYDACRLSENVPLPAHPLRLCDILHIALCRNLDVQLQAIEAAVHDRNVVAEKLRQIPSLTLEGELAKRSNEPAWFSKSLGGALGALPTISSEETTKRFDITAAFNLLDFGLTYLKTRQEKNRSLLLAQRHLRARQNLVLDIYRAYYRALVAKKAKDQAAHLIIALEKRQSDLQKQIEEQAVSEMKGLVNENLLIEMETRLYLFENEYRSAMTELSALMGLPPGCPFDLDPVAMEQLTPSTFDVCCLENDALLYRPELMAQDIQYHIDADEVRASIVRMFPHAKLFGGWYYDGDNFQFYDDWVKVGGYISWDLLSIPAKYTSKKANECRAALAWNTRLSMSMGILTQVHLARINVEETQSHYLLAQDLHRVKTRQLEVSRLMEQLGKLDTDDVLNFEVEALFAEVNALKAYANLQVSLEQLGNAIGKPLRFTGLADECPFYGLSQCCHFANACDQYECPTCDFSRHSELEMQEETVEEEQILYYEDYLEQQRYTHPS